jgi:hypothetical protein
VAPPRCPAEAPGCPGYLGYAAAQQRPKATPPAAPARPPAQPAQTASNGRTTLPNQSRCINVTWLGARDPGADKVWYKVRNSCGQALEVHWCDQPGCRRATIAATLGPGRDQQNSAPSKFGSNVTVMAACPTDSQGRSVHYDSGRNECWR